MSILLGEKRITSLGDPGKEGRTADYMAWYEPLHGLQITWVGLG